MNLKIEGEIPKQLLILLQKTWRDELELSEGETISLEEDDWYQSTTTEFTPAERLRSAREMMGLTLSELGKKLGGISPQKVSDLEKGRRGISKSLALKMSKVLQMPLDFFISSQIFTTMHNLNSTHRLLSQTNSASVCSGRFERLLWGCLELCILCHH